MNNSAIQKFNWCIAHLNLLIAITFLSGSLWIQFYEATLPTPIIILHRIGFIIAVSGYAFILQQGIRNNQITSKSIASGLGMSLLGSFIASAVVLRQLIYAIDPLKIDYGTAIFGQHHYAWTFVLFLIVIIDVSLQLLFGGVSDSQNTNTKAIFTKIILTTFLFLIFAHLVALLFQSGTNLFLEENPSGYLLIDEK